VTSSTINGTAGNDNLTGTPGNDTFNLTRGGNDTVSGAAGNDVMKFGATLTCADQIDGGSGSDAVTIKGDYSAGLIFLATTMINVEALTLSGGFSYALTTGDATVAAGATLKVNASTLLAGDSLTFDGAAETGGSFHIIGGAGANDVTGGARNDVFDLSRGNGHDIAHGGGGNDTFEMGSALMATDKIDGGSGFNTLVLDGMGTSDGLVFNDTTITDIQKIKLEAGHDYSITTADGNVAAGGTLVIYAASLGAGDSFTFDGSAEADSAVLNPRAPSFNGNFTIATGAGAYDLTGGAGNDTFQVGAGMTSSDHIDGGTGIDHVVMDGDYSGGNALNLAVGGMTSIQVIALKGGHSYTINAVEGSFGPANVLPTTFTCYGPHGLGNGDNFTFNDGGETGIQDRIFAGAAGSTYNLTTGSAADLFAVGGNFDAADTFNGGGGFDTLALNAQFQDIASALNADYTGANALVLGAGQLTSVEAIGLGGRYSYDITTNDGNVQAGATLAIEADGFSAYAGGGNAEMIPKLTPTDVLTFNGSAETDGHFDFQAGAGAYHLTGGQLADTFEFGAAFAAGDTIDGGGGADELSLDGDYSAGLTFGAATMTNIATLTLDASGNYNLTTNDATVAAGQTLTVDASALGAGNSLTFDGSAETDGAFHFISGAGAGNFTGGSGNDIFDYGHASFSGADFDTITGFDFSRDTIAFHTVTGTDAAVTTGSLSQATFDSDLAAALSGSLNANHAILFTADAGDLSGDTFLVIDGNGTAGYQGGSDLVIHLAGDTNTADFAAGAWATA
jgi:Ca2+-binding RTX toxin-like protein